MTVPDAPALPSPPPLPSEVWRGVDGDGDHVAVVLACEGPEAWIWTEHDDGSEWERQETDHMCAHVFRLWGEALQREADAGLKAIDVLTRSLAAMQERAERAERKTMQAFGQVKEGLARESDMQARLAIVTTDAEGVWYWQGEGDHPESLSCPVVMSADTLRAMVGRAERAEQKLAAVLRSHAAGDLAKADP